MMSVLFIILCVCPVPAEPAAGHLRPDHRVPERPGLPVPLGAGGAQPAAAVRGEEAAAGGGGGTELELELRGREEERGEQNSANAHFCVLRASGA